MSPRYSVYVTSWETCRLRHVEARSEEEAQECGRRLFEERAGCESIETGIDHVDAELEED